MQKILDQLLRNISVGAAVTFVLVLSGAIGLVTYVKAADQSQFTQQINSPAVPLLTEIRDDNGVAVAAPSVAMTAKEVSFDCHSGVNASTGIFGTNTERIYIDNLSGADNGWTLTMAATSGPTGNWTDGSSSFDFNDDEGTVAGCADDGTGTNDADSLAGQLSIDPATNGTITSDCLTCTTGNISMGSAASFDEGTTNSITLVNAAAASDDVGRWYVQAIDVSQTIPPEQPAGSYAIDMTIDVNAI